MFDNEIFPGAGGGEGGGEGGGGGSGPTLLEDEPIVGGEGGEAGGGEGSEGGEKLEDQGGERRLEPIKEEPELAEFKGMVSARLRSIVKQTPALAQVFKDHPQLQDRIEAAFRKEAAYTDVFPTVAEARFMREQFPNGQADVQELLSDVKDLEELDKSFDERDREGAYPGHVKLIENFFQRDKDAAISFMKTVPREWARLDRESYNEVMGKVVGATFASRQIPEFLTDAIAMAKEAEAPELEKGLTKLLTWVNGYLAGKPVPTEEERRLADDRKAFDRQKMETSSTEQKRFHSSFASTNLKLQRDIITGHPAIKRLVALADTVVSKEKKESIVEQIRQSTERFLAKSPSFMRKLRPAYEKRDLVETTNLQKAAWAQPWLLNRMVRAVLNKEVPQLVQSNRDAAQRRAGAPPARTPAKTGGDKGPKAPTGPYQEGGRWYNKEGRPFTTAEIIAGKHLQG
jgi:hypothetical protein